MPSRTLFPALVIALALAAPARASVDVDLGAIDQLPPEKTAPTQKAKPKPPAKAEKPRRAPSPPPARANAPPPPPEIAPIEPPARKAEASKDETKGDGKANATKTPGAVSPAADSTSTPNPAAADSAPSAPATMAPAPPPPPPAAAAAPAARPVPDAASKPAQTARTVPSRAGTIAFPPAVAELPATARPELDRVAQRLAGDERLHLQLLAFAEANDASQSRRLSLSRALAIRSYLLDRGVQPQKIELRPLGNRPEAGDRPDRVDLVFAER